MQRLTEIGKLAKKVGIDVLDDHTLLGAFLEIAEGLNDATKKMQWQKKGADFLNDPMEEKGCDLIIAFNAQPDQEVLDLLKNMSFRFNKFRREYYGHGHRKVVEEALSGTDYSLEVVEVS